MSETLKCPNCQTTIKIYRNPVPTVDIIIRIDNAIILIERKNEPFGWALPGGFVDYGETLEDAAAREAGEETGIAVRDLQQFRAYSNPNRDPRQHTISYVFTATGTGQPQAGDDAGKAQLFQLDKLPENLCFDHGEIIRDYLVQL